MIQRIGPPKSITVDRILRTGLNQFSSAQEWVQVLGCRVAVKSTVASLRWAVGGTLIAVDTDKLLVQYPGKHLTEWHKFKDVKVHLKSLQESQQHRRTISPKPLTKVRSSKPKPKAVDPREAEAQAKIQQARANEKTAEALLHEAQAERMHAEAEYVMIIGGERAN